MSYIKQHELGLAGLALLRKWLTEEDFVTKTVLDEIKILVKDASLFTPTKASRYGVFKGYKVWAATYDSIPNLLMEVEEPIVKKLLQKFPRGSVLDAACGTGRYSAFMHSLGHGVTGVDISPAMLDHARAKDPQVNFIQGDLISLPLENASIDLAICALALTHLPDIVPALSELFRVVRPGGHIIISDIHPWVVASSSRNDRHPL